MRKKVLIGFLLFLCLAVTTGYLYREPFWEKAGHFMAPQGDYRADVVILEGADYVSAGFMKTGMDMLKYGKVKKIVIVLHRIAPKHRPFGIHGDYADVVRQTIKEMGLKDEQFKIIVAPIRNPVTLREAQFVLNHLKEDKISSAILVAPSFHTRRSYLAYASVGEPLKIKIYPQADFTDFKTEKWWTSDLGWRDFIIESGKLFYYLICRHIPFKLSY